MESNPSLGECAPMQSFLENLAQDCPYLHIDQSSSDLLHRPLRSHSRQQRSIQLNHRLDSSHVGNAFQSRPRLRRTQAFSDLESGNPRFAPTVSVSVAKDSWLEESVAKAKKILFDKEKAENTSHRLYGMSSIEYLNEVSAGSSAMGQRTIKLHHKVKSQDLRTKYTSDEPKAYYGPPPMSLPSLSGGKLSPHSVENDATTSDDTLGSDNTCFSSAEARSRVCHCTFNFSIGGIVACGACIEKSVTNEAFYCLGHAQLAFGADAKEEEANAAMI